MTIDEIKRLFAEGFRSFQTESRHLFEHDVGERSLVAALSGHLAPLFERFAVDAEYNRHGTAPKYLPRYRELLMRHGFEVSDRDGPRSIDIVVHRPGDDLKNILAIEVKRSSNPEDRTRDRLKLQALRESLGYRFTLFLELSPDGSILVEEWASHED